MANVATRSRVSACSPWRLNYLWELWTGLYMLDAGEKVAFNVVLLVLLGLTGRYVVPVLPLPAIATIAAYARRASAALAAAAT